MSMQVRNCRLKVFIEGTDVTSRLSSVSGLNYALNTITQCSVTLECPQYEFFTTARDIELIRQHRSGGNKVTTFGNAMKDKFLIPYIDKKTFDNKGYLYEYGLFTSIIPINANIRVFMYIDSKWYFAFTGVIRGRSFVYDSMGRTAVTLRCSDAMTYLRLSTLSNSFGIWEPINRRKIAQMMGLADDPSDVKGGKSAEDKIEESQLSDSMFVIPRVDPSFNKFSMPTGMKFLDALVFAVFGNVVPFETLGGGDYGGTPGVSDNQTGLSSAAQSREDMVKDITIEEGGKNISITRNIAAPGLFTLENVSVSVYGSGEKAREFFTTMTRGGKVGEQEFLPYDETNWDFKAIGEDLDIWDDTISNEVKATDLSDLSVTGKPPEGVNQDAIVNMEEVVDIIGLRTKIKGLYDTSGGSLKVLLPGSLTTSVYNILQPSINLDMDNLDFSNYQTRLQVFAYTLNMRTNFVYYASPKGHIVVEFPIYDLEKFGRLDWRIFDRTEWSGSFSDTEDFDGLFSAARQTPEGGSQEIMVNGNSLVVPLEHLTQAAMNPSLFEKIGLRILDKSSVMGLRAMNEEEAKALAELSLALANRTSYGGSIGLNFTPQIMVNRPIKFPDVGRSGLVMTQSFDLTIGEALSTNVNVAYMKQMGADGKFDIVFGTKVVNMDIDYASYFNGRKVEKR